MKKMLTLEQRIKRLERLIRVSESDKRESDRLESDVKDWFWKTCVEDAYDTKGEWREHMVATTYRNNTFMVDEVMYYLLDKYDKVFLNKMRDHIKAILAKLVKVELDYDHY